MTTLIGNALPILTLFGESSKTSFKKTAHRGDRLYAPENTVASLKHAVERGFRVELDVLVTTDGKLPVIHDQHMGRTFELPSKERLRVLDLDWDTLQSSTLNIKRHEADGAYMSGDKTFKMPAEFNDLTIPSLEEVIDQLPPDAKIDIELNISNTLDTKDIEKKVVDLIQRKQIHDRVRVLSFNFVSIARVRKLDPSIETAQNVYPLKNKLLDKLWTHTNLLISKALGTTAIQLQYYKLTPEFVDRAHNMGMQVVAWAFKQTSKAEEKILIPKVIEMGVDGVIANNLDVLEGA